jgi:hypothetical protein
MTYAATLHDHDTTSLPAGAPAPSDFWTRSRPRMKAAGYGVASLIGLALGPALFVSMDHDLVVRWSNAILDLVSR